MEQAMPLAVRIGLRVLTMLALCLSIAWCIRSWDYEPVIAVITASYATLVALSAGKSKLYEILFGFARIVAYTLCSATLAVFLFGITDMFIDLTPQLILAIVISCLVLGFVYGVYSSFREVSIGYERLLAEVALTCLITNFPLLIFLLWAKEIGTAVELAIFVPIMIVISTLVVIVSADQGMVDSEVHGARQGSA